MIEAAGGVVLRSREGTMQVLVVHRVRHEDWSLPKGKLDPGEDHQTAAVREVAEETGVRAVLGAELPEVRYEVPAGPKRVRWWTMAVEGGDPAEREPDGEVDEARWVPIAEAPGLLTYPQDRHTLQAALRSLVHGEDA
ncbi:MAG: NUDIX hydrolase [Nitriliruptoraceae bacterium]|nr:NUDIX hydrolase [Nitriliruptoraceae bacterium]